MRDCDCDKGDGIKRRKTLKFLGASSVAGLTGLAGCSGGGSSDGGGGDGGGGDGGGGGGDGGDGAGGQDGTAMESDGEWPDLSGQTITFLAAEGNEQTNELWREAGEAFNEATGATLELEFPGVGSAPDERFVQLIQGGNPPELYMTLADSIAQFANVGVVDPVTTAMENISDVWGEPAEGDRLIVDGEDYTVPLGAVPNLHHYRDDIIDEKPVTWEDELNAAQAVSESEGDMNGHFIAANGGDQCVEWQVLGFGYTAGGRLATRDENGDIKIVVHNEYRDEWIAGMEHMKALHQYSPDNADADCSQMVQSILNETTAQVNYIGARQKIQAVQNDLPFADSVRPVQRPGPEEGMHNVISIIDGICVGSGSNVEAANAFIEFFWTNADYIVERLMGTPMNAIPVFPDLREELLAAAESLPSEWTQEDKQNIIQNVDEYATVTFNETDPPNPFTGDIILSYEPAEMAFDILIEDKPIPEVVDTRGENMQQVVDEAAEQLNG